MADININLEVNNGESLDSLKNNIDEVADSVKNLGDTVKDTSKEIENDTSKIAKSRSFEEVKGKYIKLGDDISKLGAGIAGAFAAANGAVGIFGDALGYSAEEMEQAQKQAASYLSIVASVKPLFEGTIAAIELGMGAYKALSAGLKSAQTAQIGLNVAMTANPIGLIVVAIAAAIAAIAAIAYAIYSFREEIYDVIQAVAEMSTGMKILIGILGGPFTLAILATIEVLKYFGVIESQATEDTKKAIEEKVIAIQKETNARISEIRKQREALIQSAKDEKTLTDEKIKALDWEMQKRQAAGEDTKQIEKEKIDTLIISAQNQLRISRSIIESMDAEMYARRQGQIETKKAMGENTEQMEKALIWEKRQRSLLIDAQLKDQTDALIELQHQRELFNIAATKAAKDAAKATKDETEVLFDDVVVMADTKFKDPFTLKIDTSFTEDEEGQEIETDDELFKNRLDKWNAFRQANSEQAKASLQDLADEWAMEVNAGIDNYSRYSGAVNSIAGSLQELQNNRLKKGEELSRKQLERRFKLEKLFAINSALMDGAKAVVGSVAASPSTFGLPFSAFAIATTAAQVAAIASKKFDGGSTASSASGPTPPTINTPSGGSNGQQFSFNTSGLSNENTPNQNISVSVEEINSTQSRVARIKEQSSLS